MAAAAAVPPAKDPQAEIEKMRLLEERIKAPSIWGRMPCGIRFEDLQDRRYEEAVRFLKKHYLTEEITYRSLKIVEDKEGTDEFIHNARIWMKDKMSIAVIKEGKEKLVGLIIMRIQEKTAFSRTFSRVKLTHNPTYAAIMTFYNKIEEEINLFEILGVKRYLKIYVLAFKARYRHREAHARTFNRVRPTYNALHTAVTKFFNELEKPVDLFDEMEVNKYLKIHLLALKFKFRHKGVGKELLKSAISMASVALVPAISGIFTTSRGQQIAEELGFQKFHEMVYSEYVINDEIVFWNTCQGNLTAALMAYRIPNIEEQILCVQVSSRFAVSDEQELEGEIEEEFEYEQN